MFQLKNLCNIFATYKQICLHLINEYLFRKNKGIHLGIILEREFKKRGLQQHPLAISKGEHPQTLNPITKGKRKLNKGLALKIEERLGQEEGTLALLQTYFDINVNL